MIPQRDDNDATAVRTYLHLSRLLARLESDRPALTGDLRLSLVRDHRRYQAGTLDAATFTERLLELLHIASGSPADGVAALAPR